MENRIDPHRLFEYSGIGNANFVNLILSMDNGLRHSSVQRIIKHHLEYSMQALERPNTVLHRQMGCPIALMHTTCGIAAAPNIENT